MTDVFITVYRQRTQPKIYEERSVQGQINQIIQYFLSKFRSARVCILFDCLQSLLDGSCKAEAKVTLFFVIFNN